MTMVLIYSILVFGHVGADTLENQGVTSHTVASQVMEAATPRLQPIQVEIEEVETTTGN